MVHEAHTFSIFTITPVAVTVNIAGELWYLEKSMKESKQHIVSEYQLTDAFTFHTEMYSFESSTAISIIIITQFLVVHIITKPISNPFTYSPICNFERFFVMWAFCLLLDRGWRSKFSTGVNLKKDIVQESDILPNWLPHGGIILAKGQLNHSYTFWY